MFALNEIEGKYRDAIEATLSDGKPLTAQLMVDLSAELYDTLKVEGIAGEPDGDMLLFQYGVYNWHDENGRHFGFDMTRQFMLPSTYEPYQLSFSLIFDPAPFENTGFFERWYSNNGDLDSFVANIKTTDGFIAANNQSPKTYNIRFSQC
jgi:hypothetical protein